MVAGPGSGGRLSRESIWTRDRHPAFWQGLFSRGSARPLDVQDIGPRRPSVNDHRSDHGGDGNGLHRRWDQWRWKNHRQRQYKALVLLALLLCALPWCIGDGMLSAADGYNQAALLFQHGQLEMSERLAGILADRFSVVAPASAARLRIVEAKASIWRGTSQAALTALQSRFP